MNGFTVGNHPVITNLINSFWVERSQLRLKISDWDLNYVLSKLIKAQLNLQSLTQWNNVNLHHGKLSFYLH